MNAHTFDSPAPICPICRRAGVIKPHKLLRGLLTCQHCRERLVVSWSGHYVRDPFTLKNLLTEQQLRQQSHPLARIRRDFRLTGSPLLFVALSSVFFLGTILALFPGAPVRNGASDLPPAAEIKTERD